MDESSSLIIPALFGMTFLAVLIVAFWQWGKVKKARREHHHSVSELQERGEAPKTYGAGDTRR